MEFIYFLLNFKLDVILIGSDDVCRCSLKVGKGFILDLCGWMDVDIGLVLL